jgi:very-short-patch-repair endonuclease
MEKERRDRISKTMKEKYSGMSWKERYGESVAEDMRKKLSKRWKGKHHTSDARSKISKALKGVSPKNLEVLIKKGEKSRIKKGERKSPHTEFKKGSTPYMAGKNHSEKSKNLMGIKQKERFKREQHPFYGKKHSQETKDKIGRTQKKRVEDNPSLRLEASIRLREIMKSPELRKRLSELKKGKKHSRETIRKILRRRDKSSLEIKFEDLINKLDLPYRFVGNGEIMVARKVPDFVHNKKKIAIEVYYRKHKEMFRGGLDVWKADRLKIFKENGWEIVFFDERQVTEENVKNILGGKNY